MGAKPWQIGVIAAGLLIGGGMVVRQVFFSGEVPVNTKFTLLDPMTGQLYTVDWNNQRFSLPARDPETDDRRLVRAFKEDGKWKVVERDLSVFENLPPEKNTIVDVETGGLKSEPKSPIAYRPKPIS
ncbi:MAG: hypothetical protein K2W85_17205 [Phycisphaerales bacterium]|nr:hypothetical protein [Phycisphaerales bacterium]